MHRFVGSSCLLSLAFLLGLPLASSAQQSVSGTVTYDGPAFRVRAIRMAADPACEKATEGKTVLDEARVVSDEGGVKNAFVWVKNPPAGDSPVPTEPVSLNQEGCMFEPRVQGIIVQQELSVENTDPTLHNVRCMADKNRPFNLGQPPGQAPRIKTFQVPEEAVKFKCDVHPWMAAYLFVMDHPYFAVTDADGKYSIPPLPAGSYTLGVWHEAFGTQEIEVEVGQTPVTGADSVLSGE